MRRKRGGLSPAHQFACAEKLAGHLIGHPLFLSSKKIACYIPVNGEMDPSAVVERALSMGKKIYLPVLVPFCENRLWFAPYKEDTQLEFNRFGIPEPCASHRHMVNPMSLDLVLTPLVAFDRHCNRLGMGGGYYDRSFSYLRRRNHWKKPRLLGIAYDFQEVDKLENESWDISLSGIATESGVRIKK
jgi:5-formyltetrahydrofolate cyclo-ligase